MLLWTHDSIIKVLNDCAFTDSQPSRLIKVGSQELNLFIWRLKCDAKTNKSHVCICMHVIQCQRVHPFGLDYSSNYLSYFSESQWMFTAFQMTSACSVPKLHRTRMTKAVICNESSRRINNWGTFDPSYMIIALDLRN